MVRKLIEWALNNPLVILLLAVALAGIGVYSYLNVNVEAYPDPAPAIVEVVAHGGGRALVGKSQHLVDHPVMRYAESQGQPAAAWQPAFGRIEDKRAEREALTRHS